MHVSFPYEYMHTEHPICVYSETCVLLCIMDTLGPTKKCPDYQGVLIFQVTLYDNAIFGTITRYVDYAGVQVS